MITETYINIAPFMNFLIYLIFILIINYTVKYFFIKKLKNKSEIIKSEIIKVFSEHYKKYGEAESDILYDNMRKLNYRLKDKYKLSKRPLNIVYEDFNYNINNVYISHVSLSKKVLHFKLSIYRIYYKPYIRYDNIVKLNRMNNINKILNE